MLAIGYGHTRVPPVRRARALDHANPRYQETFLLKTAGEAGGMLAMTQKWHILR
jgi:hypothetical protein